MTFQEFTTHPFVNDFHYIRKLLDDNRRQRLEFNQYKEENERKFALLFKEIENMKKGKEEDEKEAELMILKS